MKKIVLNKPLPALSFTATDPALHSFSDLLGKHIVLYFYPKDNTPGCTQEGKDFKDAYNAFNKLNTHILGISSDSITCHEKFSEKLKLPFALIADEDRSLCKIFDVIKEKNMYGRCILGIERSTFLIDKKGIVRQIWRKVKVKDHANLVLEAIKAL
jgi:peroxiredoxin Q/BCP